MVYPLNYQPGQRYPLIMVIHGGPEAHISNGWNNRYGSPVNYAAAQGYMVFFPNYRGSTGRGVDFSKLGQNDYAGKEFDDIVDAKNALVAAGLVDEKKVGITGGFLWRLCFGLGATAQTEHFAASVMFVGISNNLSKFGTTDIANEMHPGARTQLPVGKSGNGIWNAARFIMLSRLVPQFLLCMVKTTPGYIPASRWSYTVILKPWQVRCRFRLGVI
ncbi:hypothetical protein ALON55S_02933 [Alishewanella longhuensis]